MKVGHYISKKIDHLILVLLGSPLTCSINSSWETPVFQIKLIVQKCLARCEARALRMQITLRDFLEIWESLDSHQIYVI